jgi:hypothetical protein
MSGAQLILKVVCSQSRLAGEAARQGREMAAISAKSAHWLKLFPYQYSQTYTKRKQESGGKEIFEAD